MSTKRSEPRTPVTPLPGGQGGIRTVAHVVRKSSAPVQDKTPLQGARSVQPQTAGAA